MKKIPLYVLLACSLAVATAENSVAAVVVRSAELDLTTLALPASSLLVYVPVPAFSLDIGDTLIFHLNFAGGMLQLADPSASNLEAVALNFSTNPVGQTGFNANVEWHFEDVVGQLITSYLE